MKRTSPSGPRSSARACIFINLNGGAYSSNPLLSGFAKAATVTQISPLNSKNWGIADTTDAIIPTMMKALMQGANFTQTVDKANTALQNVLNTGKV